VTIEDILAALQAILDSAEGRELTDEEVQNYEELEGKLTAAKRSVEIRARNAAYNTVAPAVNVAAAKKDDTLDRAFDHYMRTGKENTDLVELRAQSEGTGTEGGYLVPEGFRDKLVERMKAFGGVANDVENISTTTGNDLPWPTVDDTANVGEIVDEGGTFSSGADLVFGSASLGAYAYMAGGGSSTPLRVSKELLQDAAFDVQGLVSKKLGERIARIQAPHVITGTGVKQPLGITTGLTGVTTAANNALTYADLITWIHSVDPAYRDKARWAFNDQFLAKVKKMVDSNGNPLWRPADATMATDPGGGTLLGYPITIDQAFPDFVNNSPTVNFGVFGDLSEGYVRRTVKDFELLVNPYARMSNRQVEFSAWARMDATQQNTFAYSALTGHS
jgi:HK97 family phage major capsid protein